MKRFTGKTLTYIIFFVLNIKAMPIFEQNPVLLEVVPAGQGSNRTASTPIYAVDDDIFTNKSPSGLGSISSPTDIPNDFENPEEYFSGGGGSEVNKPVVPNNQNAEYQKKMTTEEPVGEDYYSGSGGSEIRNKKLSVYNNEDIVPSGLRNVDLSHEEYFSGGGGSGVGKNNDFFFEGENVPKGQGNVDFPDEESLLGGEIPVKDNVSGSGGSVIGKKHNKVYEDQGEIVPSGRGDTNLPDSNYVNGNGGSEIGDNDFDNSFSDVKTKTYRNQFGDEKTVTTVTKPTTVRDNGYPQNRNKKTSLYAGDKEFVDVDVTPRRRRSKKSKKNKSKKGDSSNIIGLLSSNKGPIPLMPDLKIALPGLDIQSGKDQPEYGGISLNGPGFDSALGL